MFDRIVDHVAALAERREIILCAVRRIVIEMGAGQHDPCRADEREDVVAGGSNPASPAIAPDTTARIPPPPVAQMYDDLPMRSVAMVAAPLGAREAHELRQFAPVDRIEPAMFGADRHETMILSHSG